MHESNQGPADEIAPPRLEESAPAWIPEAPGPDSFTPPLSDSPRAAVQRGLGIWFGVISVLGIAGVVLGQAELVIMVALSGVFVAAQAADRDPSRERLRLMLSAVFVIGGAFIFGMMAVWLWDTAPTSTIKVIAVGIAGGGALLCLITSFRSYADGLSYGFFRTTETSHTLRLAARLVLMILLVAVPGWVSAPFLLDQLNDLNQPLLDTGQMISSVIGLTLLALASVGYLIRRDLRQTLERLGLAAIKPSHVGVVVLGVVILYFINLGTEALQRLWFPAQWAHDQHINQMIAGSLTLPSALLLGVTAGVGEELAMRGALQPRLGVFLTSAAFASLHFHYSWFGMLMIFVLGAVLGIIRQRTSTTAAIVVHSLYDIAAVFAAGGVSR